ncbi:hypothetical protein BG006_001442 [Podila minutissima]|uniref:Uncharacterized protein n=1 Tax=Podila minutissima TaxID=64525 RepID=A0A9P5SA93_9FUNG|nr:hypothetical protein BG006_001442 [Podila minutissima]
MTSVEQAAPAPVDAQEIGAMFANEYYTFLNKEPARLHCFYSKDSTLSHGFQGEKETDVCVGQQAIKTKIGGLDFENCRVLVTNIDCQQSLGGSIIIQILGELANRGGPSQKFSQTFLLAEQPKGYYVLNDIFRYLKDDYDDEHIEGQEDEAPKTEEDAPQIQIQVEVGEPVVEDVATPVPIVVETDATKVSETIVTIDIEVPETPVDDKKADKKKIERKPDRKKDNKKEAKKDETSPSPSPSSAPENVEEAQAPVFVEPPKPEALTTWANLTAKNLTQGGTNVAPVKASVTVSTSPTPVPAPVASAPVTKSPVQKPHPHGDRPRVEYHSIYIKNVTERMTLDQLREAFTKFGTVKHLEYARVRNCAFLDFATPDAMNAALKQAHVLVGSEHVLAEERRRNNNSNGFQNRPYYNNNSNNNNNNNNNNSSNSNSNNNNININNNNNNTHQNGSVGSHIPRSEQKPFTNGHQSTQGGRGRGGHRGRGGFHNRPDTAAPTVAVK